MSRYFGRGRGVTFYVWTSDQHTHYATRVVRTTVRDATYVLDGILDNQTELPIEKHTTDTAGYSDIIFALFDLLGLQCSHHASQASPTAASTGSAAPAQRPPLTFGAADSVRLHPCAPVARQSARVRAGFDRIQPERALRRSACNFHESPVFSGVPPLPVLQFESP